MEIILKTESSVFCAYYTEWNQDTYTRVKPFRERPFSMPAGSTGGAPVVCGKSFLAGLVKECDAVFEWDGAQLKITAPQDAVFISNALTEQKRWQEYHQRLNIQFRKAPFGGMPEYCTWLEQNRKTASGKPDDAMQELNETLIHKYLKTVKESGLPSGRFTVDAGWSPAEGPGGFGDWNPRDGLDMMGIADAIAAEGHVPGLWMAPSLIHMDSDRARQYPALVGPRVEMGGECLWSRFNYTVPSEASQEMIQDMFRRAFEWGFRKFKLDIFYGPKRDMQRLSEQCRIAADQLPEPVELEGHVPDPFIARYMDVLRINDLLISDQYPGWKQVFAAHLKVCSQSAPGMMLNLDHIGGNSTAVTEELFIEHLNEMMAHIESGYPCVSLLPHVLGDRAVLALETALTITAREN